MYYSHSKVTLLGTELVEIQNERNLMNSSHRDMSKRNDFQTRGTYFE